MIKLKTTLTIAAAVTLGVTAVASASAFAGKVLVSPMSNARGNVSNRSADHRGALHVIENCPESLGRGPGSI
jgi:hypothetical protein